MNTQVLLYFIALSYSYWVSSKTFSEAEEKETGKLAFFLEH